MNYRIDSTLLGETVRRGDFEIATFNTYDDAREYVDFLEARDAPRRFYVLADHNVERGEIVSVPGFAGVALGAVAAGDEIEIEVGGVYDVPAADDFSIGDRAYWSPSGAVRQQTATVLGVVTAASVNGGVRVKLLGPLENPPNVRDPAPGVLPNP